MTKLMHNSFQFFLTESQKLSSTRADVAKDWTDSSNENFTETVNTSHFIDIFILKCLYIVKMKS